jgi:hypothetical protein
MYAYTHVYHQIIGSICWGLQACVGKEQKALCCNGRLIRGDDEMASFDPLFIKICVRKLYILES